MSRLLSLPIPTFVPLVLVCVFAWLTAGTAKAQQPNLPLEAIQGAFSEGEVKPLIARTGERMEVFVLGDGMLYTKGQAHYVLEDFFEANPPVSFNITEVAWAGESWFVSGVYRSEKETDAYRVYVRLRSEVTEREEHKWNIREIHISRAVE